MDYISKINTYPTLYQDPFLLIKHVPEQETLFYKLSGYLEEPEGNIFFRKVLEEIEATKARKLVADLAEFKGGSITLAKYIDQVWTYKLANAGVIRIAFTNPRSKFGKFTNKVATGSQANMLLELRGFKNLNAAFDWVEQEEKNH